MAASMDASTALAQFSSEVSLPPAEFDTADDHTDSFPESLTSLVEERTIARRSLIGLSLAVTAGIILGGNIQPGEAVAATKYKWPSKLRVQRASGGIVKTHYNAFVMTSISTVVSMTNRRGAVRLAIIMTGKSNQLQIIDPMGGVREKVINIAGNAIARGVAWDPRYRVLYVGVVGGDVLAYKYDTGKMTNLGRATSVATSLYGLSVDSKGRLWGGSYPHGIVWNYNPRTKKFVRLPRIDKHSDYVRALTITSDDTVYVGTGTSPKVVSFHADRPNKRTTVRLPGLPKIGFINKLEAHRDLILVSADSVPTQLVWNHRTKKRSVAAVGKARKLSSGTRTAKTNYWMNSKTLYGTITNTGKDFKIGPMPFQYPDHMWAVDGSVYMLERVGSRVKTFRYNLSTKRTTLQSTTNLKGAGVGINSLMANSDGKIYIGGYQGQGIATLDSRTGKRWQSLDSCAPNQIEGMLQWSAGKTFIGSYGSADIIRFSTARTREGTKAFKHMDRLSTKYHQSRPFGWAKNKSRVFFGTVPDYGRAGGALGIINPATDKVEAVFNKVVPGHSIIGLTADEKFVYGTTSTRNGYGIPDTKGSARVFAFNLRTKKLAWSRPISGFRAVYDPVLVDGRLVAATVDGVVVINAKNGSVMAKHSFTGRKDKYNRPGWHSMSLARLGKGARFVHAGAGAVFVVDLAHGTVRAVKGTANTGSALAVTSSGRVFVSHKARNVVQIAV